MDSEYISEAEAYKSQLDTSVRALKNVRKKRDEYYEETVRLRERIKELEEAVQLHIGSVRYLVSTIEECDEAIGLNLDPEDWNVIREIKSALSNKEG